MILSRFAIFIKNRLRTTARDNSLGFEEKMKHLIAEIANFLGEPDYMR